MKEIKSLSNEELVQIYNILKDYMDYLNSQKSKLEEENKKKNTRTNW